MLRVTGLLLLLGSTVVAQGGRVRVRLAEQKTATATPRILFPQVRLALRTKRPGGLEGVPALSKDARYAVARLGGRTLPLAFDAPGGALALGQLYTGGREPAIGHARAGSQGGLLVDFRDVRAGAIHIDVRLQYRGLDVVDAGLQPSRHRRGRAAIAGAVRELILVDGDGDGRYDGKRDRWVALRADRLRETRALRRAETQLLTEPQIPFLQDGNAIMIDGVARDGSSALLVLDRPGTSEAKVLQRRYREVRAAYYERFAREQATFVKRNGLDPRRPRAKKTRRWLSLSLEEGKARAVQEKKPLLVHFMTETNAWCFRYEYYTFPDREVDALLGRFVLVRIDAEKDPADSYRKSGARGLPALLPMTVTGRPVEFRVRNRGPDGKASDLEQKERVITGWQRPQELVTNLQRILKAAGG